MDRYRCIQISRLTIVSTTPTTPTPTPTTTNSTSNTKIYYAYNRINSRLIVLLYGEIKRFAKKAGKEITKDDPKILELNKQANLIFSKVDLSKLKEAGIPIEDIECFYAYAQKVEKGVLGSLNASMARTNLLIASAHHMIYSVFEEHMDEPGEKERYEQILELLALWIEIKDNYIDKKTDFSFSDICDLQHRADRMCKLYCHLFGAIKITPYLHDLFHGNFRDQLVRYKNLYRFSNVGPEAAVGSMRSVGDRRCNRGHTGRDGRGGVIECLQNISLRKLTRVIDKIASKGSEAGNTNYISYEDRFVAEGKAERNEKNKAYYHHRQNAVEREYAERARSESDPAPETEEDHGIRIDIDIDMDIDDLVRGSGTGECSNDTTSTSEVV